MIVCLCLDDREGLFFNHLRQSRDRAVLQDMGKTVGPGRLWVHPYSLPLLQGWEGDLRADENFLNLAGPGEYCFAEGQLLAPYREKLESLVLYRWNRRYPADVYFDLDLSQWRLVSRQEFPGTSHDTITKEVYLP